MAVRSSVAVSIIRANSLKLAVFSNFMNEETTRSDHLIETICLSCFNFGRSRQSIKDS